MKVILSALSFVFLVSLPVHAATIINLNGRTDSILSPVNLNLAAGTYSVTPIDPVQNPVFTGFSAWASSSCTNPLGCTQTSPTSVTGFLHTYDVISSDIVAASVGGVALTSVSAGPLPSDIFGNFWEKSATSNFVRVNEGIVYPTALDAFQSAQSMTFTLDKASTVLFGHLDTLPADNRGGISLLIDAVTAPPPPPPTIPVPAGLPLMLTALLAFSALRRRR